MFLASLNLPFQFAICAVGITAGEADKLRRVKGAWRRTGMIERFEKEVAQWDEANGYSVEFAQNVLRQIQGFGSYGFREIHAASVALLVSVSAWIALSLLKIEPAAKVGIQNQRLTAGWDETYLEKILRGR